MVLGYNQSGFLSIITSQRTESRAKRGERGIWQRLYWEPLIRYELTTWDNIDIMNKKNKLVVFDVDGTLVDSKKLHHSALIETLNDYKFKRLNLDFSSYKHHTDSWIVKEIFKQNGKEFKNEKSTFISTMVSHFNNKIAINKLSAISGANEFIDYLHQNTDWGICFATGSFGDLAKIKLSNTCIHYNESLLVHSDNHYSRDDIVNSAISKSKKYYGVDNFTTTVSIGDGVWDKYTADNLGLEFIGISDVCDSQTLIDAGTKKFFYNFENLDNILMALSEFK
jgi:phosphoglycolate phosphatase-like HAD superfamily hydrolase